jgi:ATP-binding cassette subfamily F protein uup
VNFLNLENVSKTYGEKILFDHIDLQVNKGQKIALVAKNGSGKSTLLRVIAGQEAGEGETAKVLLRKDIKVGFLNQDPDFYEGHTVLDAVLESDNPQILAAKAYEEAMLFPEKTEQMQKAAAKMDDLKAWDMDARIKEVLFKLNITDFNQLVRNLSGGQKKTPGTGQTNHRRTRIPHPGRADQPPRYRYDRMAGRIPPAS